MNKKIHSVILIVVTAAILSGCNPAAGQETTIPTEGGVTTAETAASTTLATEVLGETMPSIQAPVFPIDISIREDLPAPSIYRTLFRANIWQNEQRLTVVRRLAEGEQVTVVAKVGVPELQYALLDSGEYVLFVLLESVSDETMVATSSTTSAATTTSATTKATTQSQTSQATTQTTTQTTTQATTQATTQSTTTQTTKAPTPMPTSVPTPTPAETKATEWYEDPAQQPKFKDGTQIWGVNEDQKIYYELDNSGQFWIWNPSTSEWIWQFNSSVRFPGTTPANYPW